MALENSGGPRARPMKVISRMINSMGKANTHGKMAKPTQAGGRMENSTAKVYLKTAPKV